MPAICEVMRELYLPAPKPNIAPLVTKAYAGEGLRMLETRAQEYSDDLANCRRRRESEDNGRTWTEWETVMGEDPPVQGDCTLEESPGAACFDPAAGKVIQLVFQRVIIGDPVKAMERWWRGGLMCFFDHGFYRIGDEAGREWGPQRQLRYEAGEPFHPDDWGRAGYLRRNQMYIGYNVIATAGGAVVLAAGMVPVPYLETEEELKLPDYGWIGRVAGARVAVGRWNAGREDYDWTWSAPLWVPRQVSTRGLMEPIVAELQDGRLLVDMRGSNGGPGADKRPGRRWISTSDDGGLTWKPVSHLCYDTGEPFHSPSSMTLMFRHSVTGKLYWVGNISDSPVSGNLPRHPLVIAEVEETIPALRKSTLTTIDARNPATDSADLCLSNFCLFEDRETHEVELYMNRAGEKLGGAEAFTTNAWKYTLRMR
jgi:hypothetical protein